MSDHLAPFALQAAFPPSLTGRDSCDYYEASVAIGLASRRRSRVRPCCTCRAERRWPTHLLECPHWASLRAPEVRRQKRNTVAGHGTGSDVFPVDGGLHLVEIGHQAIQLSPYSASPAAPPPVRLGTTTAFLACSCPLHPSDPGKPSDPGTSLQVLPAAPTRIRLVLDAREWPGGRR
jgi:hypothetical protein